MEPSSSSGLNPRIQFWKKVWKKENGLLKRQIDNGLGYLIEDADGEVWVAGNLVITAAESESSGDVSVSEHVVMMTPTSELCQGNDQLGQLTGDLAALRLSHESWYSTQQQMLDD